MFDTLDSLKSSPSFSLTTVALKERLLELGAVDGAWLGLHASCKCTVVDVSCSGGVIGKEGQAGGGGPRGCGRVAFQAFATVILSW